MTFLPKWVLPVSIRKFENQNLTEEYRKKIFVFISVLAAIPILTGYGINFWVKKNLMFDVFLNFTAAACFLVILHLIKRGVHDKIIYRFGIAVIGFLLVYNIGFGPYAESETLWILVFPAAIFYLFGTHEGLFWILLILFPSLIFIFSPDLFETYVYPIHFRIAFTLSIILSVTFSYMLESLRAYFFGLIEEKNIKLTNALADIKKLSGLLPICASCKKIRDDDGYWNQIESYIKKHSEAEFSHGICPQCEKKFYGKEDWYIEMKKGK